MIYQLFMDKSLSFSFWILKFNFFFYCDFFSMLTYDASVWQVFGALSQLECGNDVWERVLLQSLELLSDSNDELLAATIDFVFKAASQCQHLPEAVCIFIFLIIMF